MMHRGCAEALFSAPYLNTFDKDGRAPAFEGELKGYYWSLQFSRRSLNFQALGPEIARHSGFLPPSCAS
jgi:hypothetical protein